MDEALVSDSPDPSGSSSDSSAPARWPIAALAIAAFVVVLDQLTKAWAVDALEATSCRVDDACIDVVWKLRLHLAFNPGASFSSFAGGGKILGLIAIGMAAYLFYLASRTTDQKLMVLFGVVAGGAIGNLADRVLRAEDGMLSGEVVDFIDFQFWPIFNVADIAVVCGVITLAFRLWQNDRSEVAATESGSDRSGMIDPG